MKLQYDVFQPSRKNEIKFPIVMLHCEFDSRKTWLHVAPGIADATGRKVYVLDARNHGDSPWSEDMSWKLLVDDLEEFLDDRGIPKAILVGHGMGGTTAFSFALKEPNKVEKFISIGISPNSAITNDKQGIARIGLLLKDSIKHVPLDAIEEPTAKEAILRYFFAQNNGWPPLLTKFNLESLPVKREGGAFVWKTNIDAVMNFLQSYHNSSFKGVFRGDALFFYGAQSGLRVWEDSSTREHFPRAVIIGAARSGHVIHHDISDNFVKFVSAYINGPLNALASNL